MPNQFSRPGVLRWAPDSSEFGAPPGVLLRADNLDFEEPAIIRKRRGSATVYTGLGSLTHSLYTAYIDSTRVRLAGVDDKVYANGVDLGRTFDGSGDIAFCSWLGHVFMARGETRLKYDGTRVTNWGIPKPGKRLVPTAGSQIQEYFATCNQSESPAFIATEGTITATYPDGSDGTANGSIELTPAATGRATITKTFGTVTDFFNVDGYAGSATDIIDVHAWFDKPEEVESVILMFGVSAADVSDPFRDDYYQFTFKIGGSATTAPQEEVIIKSSQAVAESLEQSFAQASVNPSAGAEGGSGSFDVVLNPPHDPIELIPLNSGDVSVQTILEDIDRIPLQTRGVIDFRPDASYNPGWTHLTVSRGQLTRQGTTTERDWETVRACRIVYKAKAGSTGKARFDSFQIYGGGERALTGKFSFLYREVRAAANPNGNYEYSEKSPPSDPSPYVNFRTQKAQLTVGIEALSSFDPQTNQLWVYMHGGYLDDWYRVAITGSSANDTSMAIDEFAKSPDGNISAFDRTRFNQFGLSIPGETTPFSPNDISGLKLWLDASSITGVSEGALLEYWPGRVDYAAFTPTDVSSLKAWFKADAGVYSDAGVTPAVDGGTVQQWSDQTGNGYHVSQATGASKPIYRTGIVNGKPVLRFDGLDDAMAGTTMSNLFTVGAKYAITVFNASTIVTGTYLWSDNGVITGHGFNSTTGLLATNDDGAIDTAAAAMSAGTWYIGTYAHGTDQWTNVQNLGSSVTSGSFFGGLTVAASGNSTGLAGTHIVGNAGGGGGLFHGDIAEILYFNAIPSASERLKLERYLANKYGITYNYGSTDTTLSGRSGSASLKPVYKSSWRGSRPAVYFDGTDALEICAIGSDVLAVGAKTVFIVGEIDALIGTPAGAGSVDNNQPLTAGLTIPVLAYSGSIQSENNDGADDFTAARAYSLDAPYIWTMLHNGTTLYNGQNDTRTASMNTVASGNTTALTTTLRLGGSLSTTANRFFKGYVAEVLVYNEALTETNRQKVESYLASKYGLTSSIPYGLTESFNAEADTTDDLIITLSTSELGARVGNERLPAGIFRPPENIVSMDAPYAERLWCLDEKGFLYFSLRREPGVFAYSHAFKVADKTSTPYWVKRTTQGVYVGTAKDIYWIYGSGAEDPDTGVPDFTKIALNVADPPVNKAVTTDGNDLLYMAARGPMRLNQNEVTPIQLGDSSLLWKDETRHSVSAVNRSGRFAIAGTQGDYFYMVPEGASDQSTAVVYKFTDYGQFNRWRRFTYPWIFSTIYREPDGTLIGGTTNGKVIQLETGTQDDSTDVDIVLWTPFEDAGYPLNRKDPFDFTLKGDTGNQALSVALHKDGSASASVTLSVTLNGLDTFLDDVDSLGVIRSLQMRMTGSFSTLKIAEYNTAFRPRPQMRTHVDSGYLRKAGEDLIWYRVARVCLSASADVSLEFWFDDTLYATKNVTVTADKTTVYTVPLGREYKGYQPRVVVRKQDQASTVADAGFELYWLELRQRPSGNITGLDVRKVFTDLAVPLETKEKPRDSS